MNTHDVVVSKMILAAIAPRPAASLIGIGQHGLFGAEMKECSNVAEAYCLLSIVEWRAVCDNSKAVCGGYLLADWQ